MTRDFRGRDGLRGPRGYPGVDGEDGKSVDLDQIKQWVDAAVGLAPKPVDGQDGPPGLDGRDGNDADPATVRAMVAEALQKNEIPEPIQGPPGDIGPMPHHEWSATRLRFEQRAGVWGAFTELKGEKGEKGETRIFHSGGGGGGMMPIQPVISVNNYFPGGWL